MNVIKTLKKNNFLPVYSHYLLQFEMQDSQISNSKYQFDLREIRSLGYVPTIQEQVIRRFLLVLHK